MRATLCIQLPFWSTDRLARHHAHGRSLLLYDTHGDRRVVCSVCPRGLEKGIRPGMSVDEAQLLCNLSIALPKDHAADQKGLVALARWMIRFTPVVAASSPQPGDDAATLPHAIFLDVEGCDHLYGGFENLLDQVHREVGRLDLHARVSLAPSPGAAWLLAFASPGRCVGGMDAWREIAPSLPVLGLRLDAATLRKLADLGIRQVGQLMQLPRGDLACRFSADLLLRLDQAMGLAAEPLSPVADHLDVRVGVRFDAGVESLEHLRPILGHLVARMVKELVRRGHGARQVRLELKRSHGDPVSKQITLPTPSQDAPLMLRLMTIGIETEDSGEARVMEVNLHVTREEKVRPVQQSLQDQPVESRPLAVLVEALSQRLGGNRVLRVQSRESWLPEYAWRAVPWNAWTRPDEPRIRDLSPAEHRPGEEFHCIPSVLLPDPRLIEVEEEDGTMARVIVGTKPLEVRSCRGPHQVCGPWWLGRTKTRDYFDIEDEEGNRWWVFRVCQTGRWYVQGWF